jgi:DNA-binding MarR family transcriptional regulator
VPLNDDEFARLFAFRVGLLQFLRFSENAAAHAGVTRGQYQLILAVRGLGGSPSVREVAEALSLRHHSAVGLIDRAVDAGLVRRIADEHDHRVVRLKLTANGARMVERLATEHVEELKHFAPLVQAVNANGNRKS